MHLHFDRGTILLREPPRGVDLSDLPGVRWDPRVGAHRAPAMLHASLRAELLRRGVAFTDGLDRPADELATWEMPSLRLYQEAVARAGPYPRPARAVGAPALGRLLGPRGLPRRRPAPRRAGYRGDLRERVAPDAADRRPVRAGHRGRGPPLR